MHDPHSLAGRWLARLTLESLRGFEACARLGSFTAAAEALCLTQSAVSKQIKALEDVLGRPVFVRGARALVLTDDGRLLLAGVQEALGRLAQTLEALAPSGRITVSVTAPPAWASLWLAPRLALYRQGAPAVDIRLDASEDSLSLEREGLDLAIRLSPVDAAAASWTLLRREQLHLVAAPPLARQVRRAQDLLDCPLLAFDHPAARQPGMGWTHWYAHLGLRPRPGQAVHRFSQYEHLLKAAQEGLGVAIGRRPLTDSLMASGLLAPVLPGRAMPGLGYFLLRSARAVAQAEVEGLAAWITREMREASDEAG